MNAKKVKMPFGVSGYNEGMSIRNNTGRSITIRGRDNTLIRLSPNGFDENIERGVYYTVGFRGSEFVATDSSRHDGNRNLTSGKRAARARTVLVPLNARGELNLETPADMIARIDAALAAVSG